MTQVTNPNWSFSEAINLFNTMYKLPLATYPTLSQANPNPVTRLANFRKTIEKEITEESDIQKLLAVGYESEDQKLDALTEIADWLGDIQVYAASEIAKFGLDNDVVLAIIMNSNFSKQNPDGSTSYDEAGKVMKGPNFYKPEPALRAYIQQARIKNRQYNAYVTTEVNLTVTHEAKLDPLTIKDFAAQRAYTIQGVVDSVVAGTSL